MSEIISEKSEEAVFARRFKAFVRDHLLVEDENGERSGEWLIDSSGQMTPLIFNCVRFKAADLEDVDPEDPGELFAEDGLPKQEMTLEIGYHHYHEDAGRFDSLYKATFYERAVDDPLADEAFSLYFLGRDDSNPGVQYRRIERLVEGIESLEATNGSMCPGSIDSRRKW